MICCTYTPDSVVVAESRAASALFDITVEACRAALTVAVERGLLSAHEALSSARFRLVMDEFAAVRKGDCRTGSKARNSGEIRSEVSQIGSQQARVYYTSNVDAAKKKPLDELYVTPNFIRNVPPEDQGSRGPVPATKFFETVSRTVVLGHPGGGKSTLVNKITHDLASRYADRLIAGRELTPIVVILRDYGSEKKNRKCSILEFIESTTNSKYQVKPSTGTVEYLLVSGRALRSCSTGWTNGLMENSREEIKCRYRGFLWTLPASIPILVTGPGEYGYETSATTASVVSRTWTMQTPFDEGIIVLEYANKVGSQRTET